MALISLFTAVISICSWLTIPAAVPFTLQTFAVFCSMFILGGKRSLISATLYLMLGAIGIPVFSGMRGGIGVLLGGTGGYIFGFFFCTLAYLIITEIFGSGKITRLFAAVSGICVCYFFGTVYFVILHMNKENPISFGTALLTCVVPYVGWDIIKLVTAFIVSERIRGVIY